MAFIGVMLLIGIVKKNAIPHDRFRDRGPAPDRAAGEDATTGACLCASARL